MQSLEEKDSMELGSAGQVEDLAYDPIHRCPVCGQMARCFTVDGFHNCNLCGSTWRELPDIGLMSVNHVVV